MTRSNTLRSAKIGPARKSQNHRGNFFVLNEVFSGKFIFKIANGKYQDKVQGIGKCQNLES